MTKQRQSLTEIPSLAQYNKASRLHFLDVNTGAKERILRRFPGNGFDYPHRFVWLKPNLFAVSMEARRSREGNFVFIDLKEGEGK